MHRPENQSSFRDRQPRLAVPWQPRNESLKQSIDALLNGPWKSPFGKTADLDSPESPLYIGPSWIASLHARNALLGSLVLHAMVIMFFVLRPIPVVPAEETEPENARYDLTWYPMRDLPHLSYPGKRSANAARNSANKSIPRLGADAYHPRQTIISNPVVPTHPRQTLIVPHAPLKAPKILPPLPNVVQWQEIAPSPQPARPSLSAQVSRQTPVVPQSGAHKVASPDIRAGENPASNLLFADATPVVPRPRLPVPPGGSRAKTPASRTSGAAALAPQIGAATGGSASAQNWIALSAEPASGPPPPTPPEGNLSAKFSVSPDGTRRGDPSGSANGSAEGGAGGGSGAGAAGSGGGGGGGPAGITIAGGNPNGTISGSGSGSPMGREGIRPAGTLAGGPPLHVLPGSAAAAPAVRARSGEAAPMPSRLVDPEHVLRTRQFYTLFVNMPNLTSSAGSWVMNFVELDAEGNPVPRHDGLEAPVPIHKVDPKYPQNMINANVQGEVLLYAIIRTDGSVDSVQLVRGIEPELDHNAMLALAQWKFHPATRNNHPVELETLVRIPFRFNPL